MSAPQKEQFFRTASALTTFVAVGTPAGPFRLERMKRKATAAATATTAIPMTA
jgi:BRCT domain type II-containing protein